MNNEYNNLHVYDMIMNGLDSIASEDATFIFYEELLNLNL